MYSQGDHLAHGRLPAHPQPVPRLGVLHRGGGHAQRKAARPQEGGGHLRPTQPPPPGISACAGVIRLL